MSRRFAKWYLSHTHVRTLVASVALFAALWIGAVVERQVQDFTSEAGWPKNPTYFVILFAAIVLFATLRSLFVSFLQNVQHEEEEMKETLAYAASVVEQTIAGQVETSAEKINQAVTNADKRILLNAFAAVDRMRTLVEAAYHLFESRYSESSRLIDNVEFEVTFMTKSYSDGGITIPVFANRAKRAPRSMLQRAGAPAFYDRTVTARCYRDAAPRLHIVEDTSSDSYEELYPEQKKRIRSSLVAPVLSHSNEILGTLVVHCDRSNFFRTNDARFWGKVTDKFTPHLALEKTRLDHLFGSDDVWKLLDLPIPTPPF